MSIVLQITPDTYKFIEFLLQQVLVGGNELFARLGAALGGGFGGLLRGFWPIY